MIIQLNITSDYFFGCIKDTDRKKFYALFNSLKDNNIITVDDKDYGRINILKDKLDENDYKIILAGMKL